MENEKIDLRIVKTKKVLYTTLIELMKILLRWILSMML